MKKRRILYGALGLGFIVALASCSSLSLDDIFNKSTSEEETSSDETTTTTIEDETTDVTTTKGITSTTNPFTFTIPIIFPTTTKTTTSSTTTIEETTTETTTSVPSSTTTVEEVSTTTQTEDTGSVEKLTLNVTNVYDSSTLKNPTLDTYYYEGSEIPYVSIEDYLDVLQGYISASSISMTYDEDSNTYTYSKTTSDNETVQIIVSPDTNEITLTNFPFYVDALGNANTYSLTGKMVKATKEYIIDPTPVTYNLSDYGMEILQIDGNALLPEAIVNALLGSPLYMNIYYTGSGYAFDGSTASDDEKSSFPTVTLTETDELRLYSYNSLAFIIDCLFGLNDFKGFTSAYDLMADYKDDLLSTTSKTNIEATLNVLYYLLDDGHTGVASYSYFQSSHQTYSYETGPNRTAISNAYSSLSKYQSSSSSSILPHRSSSSSSSYTSSGDTALVSLDSFTIGSSSDTYHTLKNALDSINDSYSNVVINLGLNGGGSIAGMIETLGLITNEDIVMYTYNEHTGALIKYTYQVDADLDGDFTDDDAYSSYNYYILTSGYTYSAANEFANICQVGGFATILGQHTGGGACVVLPTCLPDGTSFQTSGPVAISNYNSTTNEITVVDSGIAVDYEVSYKYFYDVEELDDIIKSI